MDKTITRLKSSIFASRRVGKHRLKINCLGEFSIFWEGREPINWRSKKTQEVIAFLIQNKGKLLSSEAIIDTIWPDTDPENASHLMRNAIYYIRMALKNYGITENEISIQGRYLLTVGDVDFDVDIFERQYQALQGSEALQDYTACADRYSGDYFIDNGWLWAEQKKAVLQENYLWVVMRAAELLMQRHSYAAAEGYLLKGLSKEPYAESVILHLLDIYEQTGERMKAARLYKNYCEMVSTELGCFPTEEITEKFRSNS